MDTIADIRAKALWLEIRCNSCGRIVQTPAPRLPSRLIDDLPAHLAAAFFRCGRCGGKNLRSAMVDALATHPFAEGWKRKSGAQPSE